MVVAFFGVAAVLVMMVVGAGAALYVSDTDLFLSDETVAAASNSDQTSLSLEESRKFKSHMERGHAYFDEGEYLSAAAQSYAAWKIDSASTVAE